MLYSEVGQVRTAQHFDHAQKHPARPTHQHAGPPTEAVGGGTLGHKAQVVGLLPHLGNQGNTYRECSTKEVQVKDTCSALLTSVVRNAGKGLRITHQNKAKWHHQHDQPQRLRPNLEAADGGHAVGDQGNHHHRANQVTPGRRYVQGQLQRIGHDGRLQREEDEGERGIDQRGQRGSDVAEARAAREQVHVHPVAGGIHTDGQARQKNHQPRHQNGPEGIHKAVLH